MRTRFALAAALAAVAITTMALAAVALAAKPQDGSYSGKDLTLVVKKGKITEVQGGFGFKCNAIPIDSKKPIKVKNGKFHFKGKVNNVLSKPEGKLTLSGKFKSKTTATGTYKFVKGGCTNKKKFKVTLSPQQG